MQRRRPLAPGQPLSRQPLKRRQQPLARQSGAARKQAGAQKRAYAAAPDAGQSWCSVCGAVGPTEHMHFYTQKQRPDLANNSLNWLVVGKRCGCHRLQENNKPEFARRYPEAWATILGHMQVLDPAAFVAFRIKNPF